MAVLYTLDRITVYHLYRPSKVVIFKYRHVLITTKIIF